MTNQEFFANYGTEKWAIEENLCYLLQTYWEAARERTKNIPLKLPVNPVSFVKEFMKDEPLVDVKYAEQSKMNTLEKNVVDIPTDFIEADFQEVTESEDVGFDINDLSEDPKALFESSEIPIEQSVQTQTGPFDATKLVWPGE